MKSRLTVLLVLVVAIGLLIAVDRSSPSVRVVDAVGPVGPALPGPGAVGSTWYCAAGSAPTSPAPTHELVIANPTSTPTVAQISAVTTRVAPPTTTQVPARSSVVVAAPVSDASYVVELSTPGAVVSHRLVAGGLVDEAPCATAGATQAYLPSADTETTQHADAQLWLFNPFPSDASLDVTVVTSDGVRVPTKLSGVVVPGGSTEMFDLGKIEQRRSEFGLSVVTRSGLIVAELTQATGTPAGLVMAPGVQQTASRWLFADGESGTGLAERYVVFNPTAHDASVLVSVIPYNAAISQLPEPFELDVPPRSFVTTDMEHQTRVVQDQPHWVQIESTNAVGVVAQRLATVTGTGNPDGLASGAAASEGQTVAASRWVMGWADHNPASTSSIVIANPSGATIAETRIVSFGAGADARGASVLKAEVGPGHSAQVSLGASGATPRGLVITSSSPVVVERHIVAGSADFAVIAAVPSEPFVALPPVAAAAAPGSGG